VTAEELPAFGLASDYARAAEPLPRRGDRYTVHDYDDVPVPLVETPVDDETPIVAQRFRLVERL
jgi:hypothetical protein